MISRAAVAARMAIASRSRAVPPCMLTN
jgi:hypothetical protein